MTQDLAQKLMQFSGLPNREKMIAMLTATADFLNAERKPDSRTFHVEPSDLVLRIEEAERASLVPQIYFRPDSALQAANASYQGRSEIQLIAASQHNPIITTLLLSHEVSEGIANALRTAYSERWESIAAAFRSFQEQARDNLGMPNQAALKYFMQHKAFENGAVREEPVNAFVYMDLNFFKRLNDTFGHTEGDRQLRNAYAAFNFVLSKRPANSSQVCRLSGDEFLGASYGITPEETEKAIEEIEDLVSKQMVPPNQRTSQRRPTSRSEREQDELVMLSASVGYSLFSMVGWTPENFDDRFEGLKRLAEDYMYDRKRERKR